MSCPFLAEVFYSIENRGHDLAVVHIHLRIVKKQDKDSLTPLTTRENFRDVSLTSCSFQRRKS